MTNGSYDVGPLTAYIKRKNYVIYITHVPTNNTVNFPAFLTSFTDTFTSDWDSTSVMGRMDPIYTFKQTSRSINISFVVPSADEKEAKENLKNVRELTKYLYPTYQNNSNATTISKAPLVRIKFANLIGKGISGTGTALLGKLQGAAVAPLNEEGYFDPKSVLYPKALQVDLVFDVIHESNPGEWKDVVEKPPEREERQTVTEDPPPPAPAPTPPATATPAPTPPAPTPPAPTPPAATPPADETQPVVNENSNGTNAPEPAYNSLPRSAQRDIRKASVAFLSNRVQEALTGLGDALDEDEVYLDNADELYDAEVAEQRRRREEADDGEFGGLEDASPEEEAVVLSGSDTSTASEPQPGDSRSVTDILDGP